MPPAQPTVRSFTSLLAALACALVALGLLEGGGGALWPDVIDAFGVSKGVYGVSAGIGLTLAFPILLLGGRLTTRFDKRSLMAVASALLAVSALGLATGSGAIVLVGLLIVRGIGICLLDLSTNAVAVDVEQITDRHIMSPLHAGFSGGTVLGAGLAWLVFQIGGGRRGVYLILAGLLCLFVVVMLRERAGRPLPRTRTSVAGGSTLSLALFRRADIRILAALTGVAFGGEMLIAQWIGIYLRDERGYAASVGALAVILLGATMFAGRLANAPLTERAGPRPSLLVQGTITILGGVLIVGASSSWLAILGCGIAGLGLAGVAPTALSLAGRAFPASSGAATGAALIGGYAGVALIPFLAGLIASVGSVRVVLFGVMLGGVFVVLTGWKLEQVMGDTATLNELPA